MLTAWETKAHRVIAELARDAWRRANHDKHGRRYVTHRAYVMPDDAVALVVALGDHDRVRAEETAKAIFQRHTFGAIY